MISRVIRFYGKAYFVPGSIGCSAYPDKWVNVKRVHRCPVFEEVRTDIIPVNLTYKGHYTCYEHFKNY